MLARWREGCSREGEGQDGRERGQCPSLFETIIFVNRMEILDRCSILRKEKQSKGVEGN